MNSNTSWKKIQKRSLYNQKDKLLKLYMQFKLITIEIEQHITYSKRNLTTKDIRRQKFTAYQDNLGFI